MTVAQARAAIGQRVAVIPTDAFPAGRWTGDRRRTLHNQEVHEHAIPARLVRVERVEFDGKRSEVAAVQYEHPATGTDYFRPAAIAGRWEELEQVRRETATEGEREVRALRAGRALGNEFNATKIGERWLVAGTVEAAERIVRLAAFAAAYLHHGHTADAERCITEVIDYALPERDLKLILNAAKDTTP